MSGLLQHHRDRGHLHERQEVGRLLLVPGGRPPVLLHLRPEPLAHVPLGVQVRIDLALLGAVLLRRDDCPRAARFDLPHRRLLVVPLVRDHDPRPVVGRRAPAWPVSDSWAAVGSNSTGWPRPSKLPWTSVPNPPRLLP